MILAASMIDHRLRTLSERLKSLISQSPYTGSDIARLLKVDRSAVSRWMSGERTPTLQNLIDLASLLDVEMTELWTGPEAVPATPEQKAMLERMSHMTLEQQQAMLAAAAAFAPKP